ncbi:MAG: PEP-CTERM sorting domain-containing protein [Gammaproteobacteria bacterium]
MCRCMLIVLLGTIVAGSAHATVITHEFTHLGGNTWEAEYVVSNDTLAVAIEEITIWYESGVYENIVAVAAPTDWDPIAFQPDPLLPDDGFYDALALGAPLDPGASLGGFVVQFDLVGASAPDSQFYEVYWGSFFDSESGFTVAAQTGPGPMAMPEPGTLWLAALGTLGLARRRQARQVTA